MIFFSCGVSLFIIVFGFPPFREARNSDKYYRYFFYNKEEDFWSKYSQRISPSPQLKTLITSLLRYDSAKRITIEDALNSDWLSNGAHNQTELSNIMNAKYCKVLEEKAKLALPVILPTDAVILKEEDSNLIDQYRDIDIEDDKGLSSFKEDFQYIPHNANYSDKSCDLELTISLSKEVITLVFEEYIGLNDVYWLIAEKIIGLDFITKVVDMSYKEQDNSLHIKMLYIPCELEGGVFDHNNQEEEIFFTIQINSSNNKEFKSVFKFPLVTSSFTKRGMVMRIKQAIEKSIN